MIEELGKGIDSLSLSSFNQLFHPYSTILSASECIVSSSHSTVTGTLVGGNLAVLTSIIGSPYEINTDNTLLLLEDIGEEPYRIDRMLNQLLLSGKFNECRGVIFTSCHDCTPSKPSQSLQTILYEYFTPYAIPVLFGLPIGHISPNIGIPLGATATISTHNKTLSISSGVATRVQIKKEKRLRFSFYL